MLEGPAQDPPELGRCQDGLGILVRHLREDRREEYTLKRGIKPKEREKRHD